MVPTDSCGLIKFARVAASAWWLARAWCRSERGRRDLCNVAAIVVGGRRVDRSRLVRRLERDAKKWEPVLRNKSRDNNELPVYPLHTP